MEQLPFVTRDQSLILTAVAVTIDTAHPDNVGMIFRQENYLGNC